MLDRPAFLPLAQVSATPTTGAAPEHVAATPAPAPAANVAATGAAAPVNATQGVASTQGAGTQPAASQPAPPSGGLGQFMLPFILMLVVLYFFMFKGNRKEDKKRKLLLAELKKGDKVMTIGGMVANVVSVDGDEVVLKIDESNNTKARYRKSAIQEVLNTDEKK